MGSEDLKDLKTNENILTQADLDLIKIDLNQDISSELKLKFFANIQSEYAKHFDAANEKFYSASKNNLDENYRLINASWSRGLGRDGWGLLVLGSVFTGLAAVVLYLIARTIDATITGLRVLYNVNDSRVLKNNLEFDKQDLKNSYKNISRFTEIDATHQELFLLFKSKERLARKVENRPLENVQVVKLKSK